MFQVYDKCTVIEFNNYVSGIDFDKYSSIDEYDDEIIITTSVTIGDIDRGWCGDITFFFAGYDLEGSFSEYDAHCSKTIKDVLCRSKKFNQMDSHGVEWTYTFLKN